MEGNLNAECGLSAVMSKAPSPGPRRSTGGADFGGGSGDWGAEGLAKLTGGAGNGH